MNGKKLIPLLSTSGLLVIWKIGAILMDAPIILPSPESVLLQFFKLLIDTHFLKSFCLTAGRGAFGFFLALTGALVIGIPSGLLPSIRSAFRPLMVVLRTVPVLSVILLAVLWFNPGSVPVFVTFLMSFPIIWQAVTDGIISRDTKLQEVCDTFKIPKGDQITGFVLPAFVPALLTAVKSTVGLSWKVVVAAEILSQPILAIGTGMYTAQLRLETSEMMAWTMAAIIAGGGTEFLVNKGVCRLENRLHLKGENVET